MIPTQIPPRVIRQQEAAHQGTSGELSDLLSSIGLAVKIISQLVASAGLKGLYGYSGRKNVLDEQVQLLDEEADQTLIAVLSSSGHFGLLVSEEQDTVVATQSEQRTAKYIVAFDPLDGSSNIGSNIPVGTIFSILRKQDAAKPATMEDFLQPGTSLVAAGYSVYGAKTSFVYSTGHGVFDFTLDPSIGEFVLTEENVTVPDAGTIFSVNEGNSASWDEPLRGFVQQLKDIDSDRGTPYSGRYVGSLVADFDRTLRKGGIFLYPANKKHPEGRLRLLYECIPLSFIMEQAGGIASDGKGRVLEICPTSIHQRSGLVVGSRKEMKWFFEATRSSS